MRALGKFDEEVPYEGTSLSTEQGDHSDDDEEFHATWTNMALDPDTFGLSIVSVVRDFYLLEKGKGKAVNRISRLLTTALLLFGCVGLQVFLLSQVKRFVSAKAVHDIRIAYDKFENHMYNGHVWVLSESPTLERRGLDGYFNASAFASLTEGEQTNACRIPLSQPIFFRAVILIWTLTCIAELRKCRDLFNSLIMNTRTVQSMLDDALVDEDGIAGGELLVAGLTTTVKAIIMVLVILPRLCITLYLIWIGCRWLLATNNFADLILNSVALEFILLLKDVIYLALVPRKSMIDLENTLIKPAQEKEPESLMIFIGTLFWALLACVWVGVYMGYPGRNGFQQVLRGYKWDVHDICTDWVLKRYAV